MTENPPPLASNRLTESLARVCAERLFEEKWLVAPNLRHGYQWLERATFAGRPILNVRVTTLYHLARRIAGPELSRLEKTPVAPLSNLVLVDRVWSSLTEARDPYIGALHPSWSLLQTLGAALGSLRMAGVSSRDLSANRFEVARKGKEIQRFLSGYESELERRGWADRADLFRIATDLLLEDASRLGEEAVLLVPEDLDPLEMERRFLEAVAESKRVSLPVDPIWEGRRKSDLENPLQGEACDVVLDSRFRGNDAEETSSLQIEFFHSIGEAGEVREVLRRILSSSASLDQVEILHTQRETYVPLIQEVSQTISSSEIEGVEGLPITYEEGLPVAFSRPGKAFIGWLRWISEGYAQKVLVEMVREGLLRITKTDDQEFPPDRVAQALQSVRIGLGRDRYIEKIERKIAALRKSIDNPDTDLEDEDSDYPTEKSEPPQARLKILSVIQKKISDLIELSAAPDKDEPCASILHRTKRFLENFVAATGEVDRYAAKALTDKIDQFAQALPDDSATLNVELWDWLTDLPQSVRILGSRPRPGHLHVAPLALGGHAGRGYTFILGLDDARFPGVNLQDPILLDSERRKISGGLQTAADRFEKKIENFWRLLGRLRGQVTLSYSSREIVEDREVFPSPLWVEAHRRHTGNREEDLSRFLETLPPPVSFTPAKLEESLDAREWWLSQLTDSEAPKDPRELIQEKHPHLNRGREARAARDSDSLTAYDGRLSSESMATSENPIGPFGERGAVLSATSLEEMGRCPLAYYFRKILGIALPEDLDRDPSVWLGPREAGSLLHEVFREFIEGCIEREEPVSFEKHEVPLSRILERRIAYYRELEPPPDESAYNRQGQEFRLAARLFLKEEEILSKHHQPVRVETGFGMGAKAGTGEEAPEPIEIELSENESVRLRGRIDRIDRSAANSFALWDYKTGGTNKYRKKPPFNQGRIVQPYLYWAAANQLLETEFGPDAQVRSFGYFFPTQRGMTDRIVYRAEQLEAGREIVRDLCRLMDSGVFLPTNDKNDCTYCDFKSICGDLERIADNSEAKLANEVNRELEPFRRLREKNAD